MIENLNTKAIISPQEISKLSMETSGTRIVFVDASFYLPDSGHDALALYQKSHIPDSVFFDIRTIKDHTSPLPHMLPNLEDYERELSKIGLKNSDIIITYGQNGMIMGPCRAWWMLKGFGHKQVMVLDGGLPHWKKMGMPVTDTQTQITPTQYKATAFNSNAVTDMNSIINNCETNAYPIIDARPNARFSGESPEPRAGMRSGHIPNSINIPCSKLVNEAGCLKSKEEITALFLEAGIHVGSHNKYITTCGSGVTACSIALALDILGAQNVAVYDGSWSEWGLEDSPTIVVT